MYKPVSKSVVLITTSASKSLPVISVWVIRLPHFVKTIAKFKPTIQMEISSAENRKLIFDLFLPLGYQINTLVDFKLKPLTQQEAVNFEDGDFYFVSSGN
ncbi:MAG: hypothetical protein KBG11_04755 [Bacteroidia bacterium]|nr:hypothetical protein [Bacteroidia bacterium]